MRKFLLYLLLLAVAASAASCRKAVEKAQRNIRFEGIEKIERQGLTAYALEGRGGPAPVKISRDRMPLSDFLNTLGLTLQDVKNKLK